MGFPLVWDKPRGGRDVYWCWIANEPMIVEYKGNAPYCPICGTTMTFTKDPTKFEDDTTMHQFTVGLLKPRENSVSTEDLLKLWELTV